MSYGSSSFGSSLYGGSSTLFQVVSAQAINPYTVIVTFSESPNYSDPETFNPANYYIDVVSEGTLIGAPLAVTYGPDPNTVKLTTPPQEYVQYRVTVNPLVSSDTLHSVDPLWNSAEFTGMALPDSKIRSFLAKAIRADGINLVFARPMLVDSALTNPLNYTVREVSGAQVPVLSVTPNLPSNATRVVLNLGSSMRSSVAHEVRLSPAVHTAGGLSILPDTDVVVWVARQRVTKVSFAAFSREVKAPSDPGAQLAESLSLEEALSAVLTPLRVGPQGSDSLLESLALVEGLEVTKTGFGSYVSHAVTVTESLTRLDRMGSSEQPDGRSSSESSFASSLYLQESLFLLPEVNRGSLNPDIAKLFGNPNGLVFFSPSLVTGGAPNSSIQIDDVKACTQAYDTYTFPQPSDPQPFFLHGGGVVPTPIVSTLNSAVLFTNFYRFNEAKHKIHDRPKDTVPVLSDIGATIVLKEVWPPARVSLLNNPAWTTFDGVAGPPYDFVLADNLSPFPAPTTGPINHFINPSETLSPLESLGVSNGTSASVVDSVVMTETYDLVPGENVVQVNVSETLSASDSVLTHIGVNLFETLVMSGGVTAST